MNPLRVVLLNLSRIPPVVLLSTIVGLAGITAYTVNVQMETTKRDSLAAQTAMQNQLNEKGKAVFALKDIPEGSTITADALEERQLPKTQIPTDAISASSLVAGRQAKYGIVANAVVSQHDLTTQAIPQGFEAQLKEGQRAITFGVDNNSGVAGFIVPQSHIDILAMVGGAGDTKVAPILSDVRVIAVGPTFQKVAGTSNTPASNVTVAVDPEDAKKLVKAIVASKLYVTLRNEKDHMPVATVDVTSLYPKAAGAAAKDGTTMLSKLELPPPVVLPGESGASTGTLPEPPALKQNREIEMWSGSRKDVLPVPNS